MADVNAADTKTAALAATEALEIVELHGVKVPIDPKLMSPHMLEVIRSGRYEDREAARIPGLIEDGERVVEIGGGIGYLSSLIARENRAATIVVFEANPGLIPLIEATHRLNGVEAIVRHEIIVAAKTAETLLFYLHEHFWASSMVRLSKRSRVDVVPVRQVAFDEVLREHAPTFLIVDIEGGEGALFKGIELTGVRKVLIEIHEKVLGSAGVKALFDFFSAQDFFYDTRNSEGRVVLFRRLEEEAGST